MTDRLIKGEMHIIYDMIKRSSRKELDTIKKTIEWEQKKRLEQNNRKE